MTCASRAILWCGLVKILRDHVLTVVPVLMLLLAGAAGSLGSLDPSVRLKVLLDLGWAALSLFSIVATAAAGLALVPFEREGRTLAFLFAKPVSRRDFVIGKWLAILISAGAAVLLLGVELMWLVRVQSGEWNRQLALGLCVLLLKQAVFAALILLLSLTLSLVLVVASYGMAVAIMHARDGFVTAVAGATQGPGRTVVEMLMWTIPDMGAFDVTFGVVSGAPVSWGFLALLIVYTAATVAAILTAASLVLERTIPP